MKRFGCLFVLMLLSSSAHAGNSVSFVIGGHRVRIEAPRGCGSLSCASISIPGIYETRRRRERNDDIDAAPVLASAPAKAATPAPQLASVPIVTPPVQPAAECPAATPPSPPVIVAPPAPAPKEAAAPSVPPVPAQPATPPAPPRVTPTNDVVVPAAPPAPPVVKVTREAEDAADSPVGDWWTEGNKGMVRIEECGKALCGYVLDPKSDVIGESVLVNMKPKAADVWSGNIYSRASGATYYGTIAMKGANSLRVEACVLGRFFCSGNLWSRIVARPRGLITSSQPAPQPRS